MRTQRKTKVTQRSAVLTMSSISVWYSKRMRLNLPVKPTLIEGS
jgi:hypothetical protein